MAGYTPGPWEFHEADRKFVVRCKNPNWVPGFPKWRVLTAFEKSNPESEGNARLIAAAPDLLEALKQCVFALDSAVMLQGIAELAPFAEQARAVIVRVEGE